MRVLLMDSIFPTMKSYTKETDKLLAAEEHLNKMIGVSSTKVFKPKKHQISLVSLGSLMLQI